MNTQPHNAENGEKERDMKQLRWLVRVRQELLKVNHLDHKDGKPYRRFLFRKPLTLDCKAWLSYYYDGYTPIKAVREDLGILNDPIQYKTSNNKIYNNALDDIIKILNPEIEGHEAIYNEIKSMKK